MSEIRRKAAAAKLARKRGISLSAARTEIDTSGLDAVLDVIGGLSSSDYAASAGDGGSSGGYDGGSSGGGGDY